MFTKHISDVTSSYFKLHILSLPISLMLNRSLQPNCLQREKNKNQKPKKNQQ